MECEALTAESGPPGQLQMAKEPVWKLGVYIVMNYGRMDVWMYGCRDYGYMDCGCVDCGCTDPEYMDAWIMDVWMYGCMDV